MENEKAKFKNEFKKRIYCFALDIIKLVDSSVSGQSSRIIGGQLLRSATSIGANVIEAEAASSKRDYTKFFIYSLKSANETKFWLGLLRDSCKAGKDEVNKLLKEVHEIANILASSVITLRGNSKK